VLADCFITQVNGRNKLITLLMPISEIQDTKLREEDKVKSGNISFCKKKKSLYFPLSLAQSHLISVSCQFWCQGLWQWFVTPHLLQIELLCKSCPAPLEYLQNIETVSMNGC
jgi:hypothetical protein